MMLDIDGVIGDGSEDMKGQLMDPYIWMKVDIVEGSTVWLT